MKLLASSAISFYIDTYILIKLCIIYSSVCLSKALYSSSMNGPDIVFVPASQNLVTLAWMCLHIQDELQSFNPIEHEEFRHELSCNGMASASGTVMSLLFSATLQYIIHTYLIL